VPTACTAAPYAERIANRIASGQRFDHYLVTERHISEGDERASPPICVAVMIKLLAADRAQIWMIRAS